MRRRRPRGSGCPGDGLNARRACRADRLSRRASGRLGRVPRGRDARASRPRRGTARGRGSDRGDERGAGRRGPRIVRRAHGGRGQALSLLGGMRLQARQLAGVAFRAEHDHVGVRCGIMDQMSAALARPGRALLLECASLAARHIPVRGRLLLVDSGLRRELAAGALNERRASARRPLRVSRSNCRSFAGSRAGRRRGCHA